MIRRLIPDYDFLNNMPNELFEEFVTTPDGLPYDLLNFEGIWVPKLILLDLKLV